MHTAAEVDALLEQLKSRGASKAEIVQALSAACLGWPYVFGAWGCMCTPANRRTYADRCRAKHADYADKIVKACPVLSGKQSTCDGCQWYGVRCFDCRGFTHWLLEQVGLQLYGDTVTSQWESKSNWVAQGDIDSMPPDLVCCIFRKSHTGMYLGGGITRHCSTVVKEEPMPGNPKWLRWGIPAGLYSNAELTAAGVTFDSARNIPTIRRGAKGALVMRLQTLLNEGGAGLTVDGNFGAKTETALKDYQYQSAYGLKADGVCGPKTWLALGENPNEGLEMPEIPNDEPETTPDDPVESPIEAPKEETVTVSKSMLEYIAGCMEDLALYIREQIG